MGSITTPSESRLKRFIDIAIASTALVLLSPLLALIAALVRLSSKGPVFYRSVRLGLNGKPFTMLKFRTMQVGVPEVVAEDGSRLTLPDDPRLTPVGKVLRLGLDELPQLLNVLAGSMSIVGPRPDLPSALDHYSPPQLRRLETRPGLTGLAQIHGRNDIPWAQRLAYDVEYVNQWSLTLDLRIIAKTIPTILSTRGIFNRPSAVDSETVAEGSQIGRTSEGPES